MIPVKSIVRVLVIDDSITIRAMMEQMVSRQPGCAVVGVSANAEEARALINRLQPDLITLDLVMPGLGGLEFLDELTRTDHPRVVVVSSSAQDGSKPALEAMKHGADAVFDKSKIVSDSRGLGRLIMRTGRRGRVKVADRSKRAAIVSDPNHSGPVPSTLATAL